MKCATLQQDIADPKQMISHRNTFSALVLIIGMTSVISMSRFPENSVSQMMQSFHSHSSCRSRNVDLTMDLTVLPNVKMLKAVIIFQHGYI